jgi:hypothetical protein
MRHKLHIISFNVNSMLKAVTINKEKAFKMLNTKDLINPYHLNLSALLA